MKRMYCIGALALILAACGTTAAPATPSPSALPSTPAEAAAPATALRPNLIEIEMGSATKADQQVDLSSRINGPGQYELILLGEKGASPPDLRDLRLLIDKTDAPQYLTALRDQPGHFNLNITATRPWPKGSLILRRSLAR